MKQLLPKQSHPSVLLAPMVEIKSFRSNFWLFQTSFIQCTLETIILNKAVKFTLTRMNFGLVIYVQVSGNNNVSSAAGGLGDPAFKSELICIGSIHYCFKAKG